MTTQVGALATPVDVYTERALLGRAIPTLTAGRPVVVQRQGDHYLLVPRAAVGHRSTRRLIDLPLQPVAPVPFSTEVSAALQQSQADQSDYVAVAKQDEIVGVVSREQMLRHLAGEPANDAAVLERVLGSMREGVVLLGPDRRVRLANDTGRALLSKVDGAGDEPITTIGGEPVERVVAEAPGATRDFATSDGRVLSIMFLAPRDPRGELLMILRDVTRLRKRQRREAFRDRMVVLGELAGAVAHDFNNLLTVTMAHVDLLRRRLSGSAREMGHVDAIREASTRAAQLVRQLLAFGSRELVSPTVLDLPATLRSLDDLLRRLIGEKIELSIEVEPGLWPITADPAQIERVLANLVVNARHAMPEGGELIVKAANAPTETRRMVRLSVKDSGVGMTPEVMARIFEPYFTTRGARGTGLGLATVHGTVTQLGGAITVQSTPGVGTRFDIDLPAAEGEAEPRRLPTRSELAEARRPARVLLVEDEQAVAQAVARMLDMIGHTVVGVAHDEPTAKALIEREGAPELLLTDIALTRGSGTSLAVWVREHHPGVAVVLMSGHDATGSADEGVADAVIAKPFGRDQLDDALATALAAQR